ncbi:MAG: MFS transporter [Spongiibacteraceae bacterium]|nr:MFS transporter [Spongiibacteraceae bacterium]
MQNQHHSPGTLQGVVLILPVVLSVMGAVLLAPILPQLMKQFHDVPNANYWIPSLLSVPALCIALFSPLVGAISDKVGRRPLLITSMFVYAGFGMAPLLLDSFFAIYATRVGVGICEAVVITTSTALIGDYFSGADRDKWLGSQAACASLCAMILFPIAGALGTLSWRGPFALYGLSLFLVLGLLFFTKKDLVEKGREELANKITQCATAFPWSHMLKVCALSLVAAILFYILQFNMSSALHENFEIESTFISGVLLSVASLAVPLGAIFYRYAHKNCSISALIAFEFGILACGFVGLSYATDYKLFVLAGFLNQFGAGMVLPTMLTWAMQGLTFEVRGRGTGMWQSTFALGQFASTLSFAVVVGMMGSVIGSFQIFGVLAAVICVGAVLATCRPFSRRVEGV